MADFEFEADLLILTLHSNARALSWTPVVLS